MITQNPDTLTALSNDQLKTHLQRAYAELKLVYASLERTRDYRTAVLAVETIKEELRTNGCVIP